MKKLNNSIDEHKVIVFCVDHYNPLGLIRSLGEAGVNPIVIVVSEEPHLVTKSKYVGCHYKVSDIEAGYNLLIKEYGKESQKPFVFTCSDDIEQYLDERYDFIKDKFYFFDGGEQGRIARYMDKHEIMLAAQKVGFRIPIAEVLQRGELPKKTPYPVITKSIASTVGGWKSDVFVCQNEEELKQAYEKILSPTVLVEEYIEKANELCLDGISFNGGKQIYMPLQCYYIRFSNKSYGNYMTMSPFTDLELNEKIRKLFELTGFSGVFSIEFLVTKDNDLVFLEINFRNSTWSYASTYAGANLPMIWARSLIKGALDVSSVKLYKEPFTAMAELADFLENVPSGNVSFIKWIKEFYLCDCPYVYNNKDPRPFWLFLLNVGLRKIKRLFTY